MNRQEEEEEKDKKIPSTKEELISKIKEWIKIDNELTKLKSEVKQRTIKKKQITENLVKVMKNNAIDCFDINGGALIYKQKKTKKPISGKFLLSQLEKYYSEQPEMANTLAKHLLDNREEIVKEEIKRKINKIQLPEINTDK